MRTYKLGLIGSLAACALLTVALGCGGEDSADGASSGDPDAGTGGQDSYAGGGGHGGGGNGGGGHGGGGHSGGGHGGGGQDVGDTGSGDAAVEAVGLGEEIFRDYCVACHTIGKGDYRGPDLAGVHNRPERWQRWAKRWLEDPELMRQTNRRAERISDEWPIDMPNPELSSAEIDAVIAFILTQSASGPLESRPPVTLTDEVFDEAAQMYFDRCSGCHGTYRAGATGPDISAERSEELGTDTLAAVIRHGTPSGMAAWGTTGIFDEPQIAQLAAFLQLEPPEAPSLSLAEMRDDWQLHVAPEERPDAPAHDRDWENFFGVILRDSGHVVIFDGDTKEELVRIDTGFAVHILRSSASGRYFYAIGRDGRVTLIDLWMQTPTAVAEARGCYDARSIEGSKFDGYEDRFLVEGCYWPNQYVVFDGLTLEPLHRADIDEVAYDTGEDLREVRVAAIAASHHEPIWMMALKESGHVAVVDYSQPDFPLVKKIGAERFLHDGGWDHTGRYFLIAANMRDRIAVIDSQDQSLVTTFETGIKPHPGRGANWLDPEYGWVNATVHMGEGLLAVYGADPQQRPDVAWQVVREIPLPAAGSLFLKTHDNSPWVLVDFPISQDADIRRQVCAYSKAEGSLDHCWTVSAQDPPVHFEFDKDGDEIWVSVWGTQGEIVIYDSQTLQEIDRLTGLETPTGKFNVFNTANDVY